MSITLSGSFRRSGAAIHLRVTQILVYRAITPPFLLLQRPEHINEHINEHLIQYELTTKIGELKI